MLPLDGHEVNAGNALQLLELLDLLAGDLDALRGHLALAGSAEPGDDLVGDVHAGHLGGHVAGHTDALHGGDAGQDVDLLREAHVVGLVDPFTELLHVVNALGLDEIAAGFDLLGQSMDPPLEGVGEWVGRGADEHFRGVGDVGPTLELALVAHLFHHADELQGLDTEHALARGMVA